MVLHQSQAVKRIGVDQTRGCALIPSPKFSNDISLDRGRIPKVYFPAAESAL
jgi:hypothetical protein